jgi:hypothetical protein
VQFRKISADRLSPGYSAVSLPKSHRHQAACQAEQVDPFPGKVTRTMPWTKAATLTAVPSLLDAICMRLWVGSGRVGWRVGHCCAGLLGRDERLRSRATSPMDWTAPWRRRMTSAIRPVHPVW